jgi:tetratricopeptide (TPR) repeat protein
MNFRQIIATCLIAVGCTTTALAQDGLNAPMTKAMMDVYNQEIAANPQAYDIYFRRANEYYKFNQYLRALSDVDNAIKYAPTTETDMLFQCYSLRGDIYQVLGKHEEALADFTQALAIDPTSFMALYQKANSEYELGKYAEAKVDYNRLRANNGRSAEALTGLARVAVKENNLGLASSYMDDAVSMMSADSDIYVRRASVRRMLGNNTAAVDDYIMAISIDNNAKAFQQLIDVSNEDYPAVITALSGAIHQAPDQGMFYYIRGVVAQAHHHFPSAIADYTKIIDENMYNYAGIYGALAECQYALCNYDAAIDNANTAIGMSRNNAEYQLTLAKIYRAQQRFDAALTTINEALEQQPTSIDALIEKGKILYSLGKFDDASSIFAELLIDNPDTPTNYMLRAWVLADGSKKTADATAIYKRMLELNTDNTRLSSLYGFALLNTSKKDEAVKWADNTMLTTRDTDGSANFTAACLYAQSNEIDKAFDCLETALNKGYANRYNITVDDDARLNLSPLRSDARLKKLLLNYAYIFE